MINLCCSDDVHDDLDDDDDPTSLLLDTPTVSVVALKLFIAAQLITVEAHLRFEKDDCNFILVRKEVSYRTCAMYCRGSRGRAPPRGKRTPKGLCLRFLSGGGEPEQPFQVLVSTHPPCVTHQHGGRAGGRVCHVAERVES